MGTTYYPLDIKGAEVSTSAIPELVLIAGTNGPVGGYAFDASSREDIYFRIPIIGYGSGNVTVNLRWYSRSGSTTGAVVWGSRLAAITPGDAQSVESDAWATAATTTTTVNGTAKGDTSTAVAISSLDSLANLDDLWLNIYRDATSGSDTMSGDSIILTGFLSYSDT